MSFNSLLRRADAPRAADFPQVAHIVADLDDLALGAPFLRNRGPSVFRRLRAALRRPLAFRRMAVASAMAAAVMAVSACGDSSDPVTSPPVATVHVSPTAIVMEEGDVRQLQAVALDLAGNVLTGRPISWQSDTPSVITVSATGQIRAVGRGYAVVVGTIGGRSSSSAITVTEPETP
jgi:hypothetical protein